MKKRLTLICTAVALVAVLIVGGALAMFTDTETATNVVTIGNLDITLDETSYHSDGTAGERTPGTHNYAIMPGCNYIKDPQIHNIGDNPAWVRVNIAVSSENKELEKAIQEYLASMMETSSHWKGKDGKYYATSVLNTGNTVEVFTMKLNDIFDKKIPFFEEFQQDDLSRAKFDIEVTAEAVQADYNGTTYDLADWSDFDGTTTP